MAGTYDLRLVVLSVLVAVIASYTALGMVGRMAAVQERITKVQVLSQQIWLLGGAVVFGLGLWAMHFIGMLAYQMAVPATYNLPLVIASIAVAIAVSGIVLFMVSRLPGRVLPFCMGGTFMGMGIAAMHYVGMAALEVPATIVYQPRLVTLSVVLAIAAASSALGLAFQFPLNASFTGTLLKGGSAILMGSAIAGMHYTAMSAAKIQPLAGTTLTELTAKTPGQLDNAWLAVMIAIATLITLIVVLFASNFAQRLRVEEAQAEILRQSEKRFRSLVQNASDIIALLSSDGRFNYISPAFERTLAYPISQQQGQPLLEIVHPHEQAEIKQLLLQVQHSPAETSLTTELQLRHAQGDWKKFELVLSNLLLEPSIASIVATFHDITEREQIADNLRSALERLNFHVENTPLAVIEWDQDFRVMRWSAAAVTIFQWQPEEVLGKSVDEWPFVFDEDREYVSQAIAHLCNGSETRNVLKNRNYTRDGSIVYCEWYNSALSDAAGNFVSVLSLVLDVTEQREMQAALQRSEQGYRDLTNAIPLLIWTANAQGAIDYYNQQWYDYTGLSFEQTQDWGWQIVVHPDELPQIAQQWVHAVATGHPYECEYRLKRADGSYRWFLGRALPLFDSTGTISSWVGTCTDIDQQKRQEAADRFLAEASKELVSSLNYHKTLASVVRLAVPQLADWCTVDVLEENGTLQRLEIAHVDPAKVQLAWELHESYPEDLNQPEGIGKVLRTGQAELISEIPGNLLRSLARDENHLHILQQLGLKSYMMVPLQARGRTLGVITFVTAESHRRYDVSDLAFTEELVRHAALAVDNARLFQVAQQELRERQEVEAILRNRADELASLTKALEKRNQELDQFAYVVSHDLKAPLRAIANLSQWIEEDLEDHLTEDTQRQMELLRGRVHRMEGLIEGILQYSRAGRVTTAPQTVNVAQLLAEVIDSLAPPPEFTIEIESDMPHLVTEKLPLEQVFANLIGNAIKYHDRTDGHVKVTVQDQKDCYEFRVSDDGPGIAPQFHEKIFVIFQTLEARDKVESTGIGLSLVKKIVEDKGGTISLNSQVGQGATFSFTWPKV